MIYMVECGFADAAREDEWNAWYSGPKLNELLKVADFLSAQRFKALDARPAPYLNVTTIVSGEMFNSTDYRGHGGGAFGPWPAELILDWDRRLFSGAVQIPPVSDDQRLLLIDAQQPQADAISGELGISIDWLEGHDWQQLANYKDGVALDQSVPYRGFAVLAVSACTDLAQRDDLRVYAPVCPFQGGS